MNQRSFSLIELLVVTSIIALLTVITLPYFRAGERQLALQRAANKLAQDVRRAQNMAISASEFEGEIPGGYGVYFDTGQPKQYILFADKNNDKDYDDGEEVEILELEKMIIIHTLSPSQPLNIVFSPPDPQISISGGDTAIITLALERDLSSTQSVTINKVGLIDINE